VDIGLTRACYVEMTPHGLSIPCCDGERKLLERRARALRLPKPLTEDRRGLGWEAVRWQINPLSVLLTAWLNDIRCDPLTASARPVPSATTDGDRVEPTTLDRLRKKPKPRVSNISRHEGNHRHFAVAIAA